MIQSREILIFGVKMKIYGYEGKCNLCGGQVRKLREGLKITQTELAARMQVRGVMIDQKAISRIELGARVVADYELDALADALHTDVRWLLRGDRHTDG